jgi:glycosyltransferase involved in cell wall biosynthesis
LRQWLSTQGLTEHLAWLDTASAWPLVRALQPRRVVFDDTHGRSGHHEAAPWLERLRNGAPRRTDLRADLVLAADHSPDPAGAAVKAPRIERLPGGPDLAFVRRAAAHRGNWAQFEARALLPSRPGPMMGYAGPIDAHLDLALIASLAAARSGWQWVMVGPLLGVQASALPRAANLHWLGEQAHEVIPALMSHWQVALWPRRPDGPCSDSLPSALSEALAAGLAVVTSLPTHPGWPRAGVMAAAGVAGVLQACERVMAEPPHARELRQRRSRSLFRGASWHHGVARCAALLRDVQAAPEAAQLSEYPT